MSASRPTRDIAPTGASSEAGVFGETTSMDPIKLTRADLFDLVWTTPMKT